MTKRTAALTLVKQEFDLQPYNVISINSHAISVPRGKVHSWAMSTAAHVAVRTPGKGRTPRDDVPAGKANENNMCQPQYEVHTSAIVKIL